MWSRRQFLSSVAAVQLSRPRRPNIVFILIDDLRWDDLGCAGHPFVATPHIDRMAKEGVRFRNAFVTTPLCSPSRASFLTGLYAHSHGIIDNTRRNSQSHRLRTFPQTLQRAGYETAFIGKWHMGDDDTPRPGFDHWVSFKGQGAYRNPDIYEDGKIARVSGYMTDILNERALAFLKRSRTKPFCLYLAHKAVHPDVVQYADGSISAPGGGTFVPAERHKSLYAQQPVPRRPNVRSRAEGKPALLRKIGNLPPLGPETGTDDEIIRNRLRMLMPVEEGVGEILTVLERNGQLDDTVLVFTSDNGYFYGEHGLSVERRLAYEESARIPLLIRFPRLVKPGTLIDSFALNIDLAPALLELAGASPGGPIDGHSLVPLLKGEARPWRTSFLIEYFSDRVFPRIVNMGYRAVRTERWKYIHYTELPGMDELYDLDADPYEMHNLAGAPAAQKTLEAMKKELEQLG